MALAMFFDTILFLLHLSLTVGESFSSLEVDEAVLGKEQFFFRAPAIPLITGDPYLHTYIRGDTLTSFVTSWSSPSATRELHGMLKYGADTYRFLGGCYDSCPPSMIQKSVDIGPTATTVVLETPCETLQLKVVFLSSLFTNDLGRLSRPVHYISHQINVSNDHGRNRKNVSLYFDASAEHCTRHSSEEVLWSKYKTGNLEGIKIGTTSQNVLGFSTDSGNLNWGYLHLALLRGKKSSFCANKAETSRKEFESSGTCKDAPNNPSVAGKSKNKLVISSITHLGKVRESEVHVLSVAYDDVSSISYFGTRFKAFWTQRYETLEAGIHDTLLEYEETMLKSKQHDLRLTKQLMQRGGAKFAALGRLVYRQTLAALKLVWNHEKKQPWYFLKEISTNGDINTMDVVFPASPMLLYTNPELLKMLLMPVLEYANNGTYVSYQSPYSPHELGVYPIADHTTAQQEVMPMENTGNMFLMVAALMKHGSGTSWFYPRYWKMLKAWADYLMESLPYPEKQLCTDDFKGKMKNNTNLAAKGIVALEAFGSVICPQVEPKGACRKYAANARAFARVWTELAMGSTSDGGLHSKLSYNSDNSTYSFAYNLLWQRLLKLEEPFPKSVFAAEVKFYTKKLNRYGVPMDSRDDGTKLDWQSWVASMALTTNDEDGFVKLFDPIFAMANETTSRWPLFDLYDTKTGKKVEHGFTARPVCGGIFAALLL